MTQSVDGMALIPKALSNRLGAAHANHKRIARGALYTVLYVFAAKCFVAGRELVIAWRYGATTTVDAFQLAFTLATWLPMALAAVCTVVFVPRLIALARYPERQRGFVGELNGAMLLVSLAALLLTFVFARPAARLAAANASPVLGELTGQYLIQLAPVALLTVLIGYLTARLQARERFEFSFVEAIPAMFVIGFILVWPTVSGLPLIWGSIVGTLAAALALVFLLGRGGEALGPVQFRQESPEWRTIYGSVAVMLGAQLLVTATLPVDQMFAAPIGDGAVALFGYASRLVNLATALGFIVMARALLPVFSSTVADGDFALGRRQALQWSLLLFGIGVIAAAVGWLVTPWAVKLLFERGAFASSDTMAVAELVRYGLIQLPFYFASVALVQWVAATNRYNLIWLVSGIALACKIAVNAALVGWLGLPAIMISASVMHCLIWAVLAVLADVPVEQQRRLRDRYANEPRG